MPTAFLKTFKTTKHDSIELKKQHPTILTITITITYRQKKKRASARSTEQHQVVNSSTFQSTSDTT